jgi:hypothetical protein
VLKNDLQDQLPGIKKQNLKNEEYAKKSIQDLFPPEVMNKSVVKQFNYASSCVAINNGNGNFTIQRLPAFTQFSCVNAISCVDINHDGFTDLVTAGNKYDFLPQYERLDASFGNVLMNDGKGNFNCVDCKRSGLQVQGQVKDIAQIKSGAKNYILFLRNDDYPVMYEIKNK